MSRADNLRAELERSEQRSADLKLQLETEEAELKKRLSGTTAAEYGWCIGRVREGSESRGLMDIPGRYVAVVGPGHRAIPLVVEDLEALLVALDAAEQEHLSVSDLQRLAGQSAPWPDEEMPF